MTELRPEELHHWLTSHRDSSIAGILCAVGVWGAAFLGGYSNQITVKVGSFTLGAAIAHVGFRSRRIARSTEGILVDTQDISDQSRQNRLYEAFKPTQPTVVTVSATPASVQTFDWEQFKTTPNKFPHILIEAPTGVGKTTLAEWLLDLLPGERLVITPKRKVSQWKGVNVVGSPLNFIAIQDAFDTLLDEMENRYQLMDTGIEDFSQLNFVVDEYPLIASQCEGISDTMLMLVRAAREAGMRLVLIAQGTEGKALDIEGQTSIRECFTRIRLGQFAINHARKLKRPDLERWLQQQDRPCMVDEMPAVIPDLSGFQITPAPKPALLPGVQDASKADPEKDLLGRVKELLSQGKGKVEIIWELWHCKPGRGKDYQSAKREYERIVRQLQRNEASSSG